jgi:NADH-quinone oxidoreductase subunit L
VSSLVYYLGLVIAASTAFYMTRLYLLTFEGRRSAEARIPHAHESAWQMTLPLVVLAVLSVVALVQALPLVAGQPVFENFLSPVFSTTRNVVNTAKTVVLDTSAPGFLDYLKAWIVAMVGGVSAAFLYLKYFPSQVGKPAPAFARGVRRVAQNKFYVDELYELVVIRPVKFISFVLFRVVDSLFIDTVLVRGTAWVTTRVGSALRYVQTGDTQAYAAVMALAILGGMAYVLLHVFQVIQ